MGRPRARFRLSLKDQASGESLKVELIPAPNESPFVSNPSAGRFRVRVNGKAVAKVKEATLTEVFNRLRHWLVRRARKTAQSSGRAPGGQDAKNSGSRE